jgi:heme/copper-type cytochrome/quinol oxidase subunit 4
MIHLIVGGIGTILLLLSIIVSIIYYKNIENKFPRWMTINWLFIFMLYMVITGLCYFMYMVYPYFASFIHYLSKLL